MIQEIPYTKIKGDNGKKYIVIDVNNIRQGMTLQDALDYIQSVEEENIFRHGAT